MIYCHETINSEWFRHRLKLFLVAVFFSFFLLSSRLFDLQIVNGKRFEQLSKQNSIKFNRIRPSRGSIFDRTGKLLVESRPSFDLCIDIEKKYNVEMLSKKISLISSLNYDDLMENFHRSKLTESKKLIILHSDIDRQTLAMIRVNGYDLPGIEVNVSSKRNYIYGSSLSHLIGYVGEIGTEDLSEGEYASCKVGDIIGKYGIERSKDPDLRGKHGGLWNQVNAAGEIVKRLSTEAAVPGADVILTIDHDLQLISEAMFDGKIGALVALDPSTGEILAIVSSPSYDQNIFVSGISERDWRSMISNPINMFTNKAIQGQYPPASIYKIVTAVAGLEENVIDRYTKISCQGFHMLGDRKYLCWKAMGHGGMNVVSALAESCDVFFYMLGQELNIDCLGWYAKLFGLGAPSGIDLENEAVGLVPTSDWKKSTYGTGWQPGEKLSVAIGQSFNLVTPLQMAVMVASIANGGILYKPSVVKRVRTVSGRTCYTNAPDISSKLPFEDETIKIVQEGLRQAVKDDDGTARNIRADWVEISGKTGTAQIIGRGRCNMLSIRAKGRFMDHAWFVGYAPANNPEIALAVIVEHGGNGSKVAAPIGASVIQHYLAKKKHGEY